MTKRVDYQNPHDDLEAVHERRNAEIRAYGQAVLAEADSHLPTTIDDWDVLEVEQKVEPELPTDEQPAPDLSTEDATPPEDDAEEEASKPETAAQRKKREAAEASSQP